MTAKAKNGKPADDKIRVRLRSFDIELIDVSAKSIVDTVAKVGADFSVPFLFPPKLKSFKFFARPPAIKKPAGKLKRKRNNGLLIIIIRNRKGSRP